MEYLNVKVLDEISVLIDHWSLFFYPAFLAKQMLND